MHSLHDEKIEKLEKQANDIRISIVEMLIEAGSGHTAGPLGMADIFTYLYFHALNHRPSEPNWSNRDRLILSNGHICPVLYATMAHVGYFPLEELKTLRKFGSRLQGHPHREFLEGIETSSGPLGSGLSQAIGMTLADRIEKGRSSDKFFYCLMSDGELNAGQNWEALMLAGKEKLHNLIAIVDRNGIQIDGFTSDVMPLEPLKDKFESFNWHVIETSGHDFRAIDEAVTQAKSVFNKPSIIIAHTIPGEGVDFIKRKFGWHGTPPGKGLEDSFEKGRQGDEALRELRTLGGQINASHLD